MPSVGNCLTRENTTMKITKVATGARTAQSTPNVACLYWARKSRSASVYMMSRLPHSSRIDSTMRTLWWYMRSSGGSSGRHVGHLQRVAACGIGRTYRACGSNRHNVNHVWHYPPAARHGGPLTVNGMPINATPGSKDRGKPRP